MSARLRSKDELQDITVNSEPGLGGDFERPHVPVKTLRDHRRVAEAWPRAERSAHQSWAAHRVLVRREDRFSFIKTLDPNEPERKVEERLRPPTAQDGRDEDEEVRKGNDVPGRPDAPVAVFKAGLGAFEAAVARLSATPLSEVKRDVTPRPRSRGERLLGEARSMAFSAEEEPCQYALHQRPETYRSIEESVEVGGC